MEHYTNTYPVKTRGQWMYTARHRSIHTHTQLSHGDNVRSMTNLLSVEYDKNRVYARSQEDVISTKSSQEDNVWSMTHTYTHKVMGTMFRVWHTHTPHHVKGTKLCVLYNLIMHIQSSQSWIHCIVCDINKDLGESKEQNYCMEYPPSQSLPED